MWYWKLLNIGLYVAPYGCPNNSGWKKKGGCRGEKGSRDKNGNRPLVIVPSLYTCPGCEETYYLIWEGSQMAWKRKTSDGLTTYYRLEDCPECKGYLSYYRTVGFGEEGVDRLECMKCGHEAQI